MAIYPGASVRLISKSYISGLRITSYNRINLHVAAGYGSLYGFFNQPKRASSHFWVAKSGLVEQYVDTQYRAEADLHGNDATVSIETESKGEAWTEQQVQSLVNLCIWICNTHAIPKQLAQNAHLGATSKGISWHRLGIDGNFPPLPSRYAGRLQRGGGMHYSNSRGKTCPVEPPIDQIYDRIGPGVSGGSTTPPPPSGGGSTPTPPPVTGALVVDGSWGSATTKRLQQYLGTDVIDGVLSHQYPQDGINYPGLYSAQWDNTLIGSNCIRVLQRKIGAKDDGLMGKDSITKLQKHLGTAQDGKISTPTSNMVKELQRRLNANNL